MAVGTVSAPGLADAERAAAALAEAGAGRVVLFGSVARGDATERSDIDLVAIFDDLDYGEWWQKRCELVRLAGEAADHSVDVSVTDRAEWAMRTSRVLTSFEGRAARDGVVLVDRPAAVDVDWGKEMVRPDSDYEEALYRSRNTRVAMVGLFNDLSPGKGEQGVNRALALVGLEARLLQGCGHAQKAIETAVKSLIHLGSDPARPAWGHDIGELCTRLAEPHRTALPALLEPLGADAITPWHTDSVYHRDGQDAEATPELLAELARTACRVVSYTVDQFPAGDPTAVDVRAYIGLIEDHLRGYDLVTGEPYLSGGGSLG